MNKIESTVRILVIELAGRRFFCGMDERRIVFFKKIVLLLLPSRSTEYNTGITVYRDNKEFTTGFPTTTTGHVEQYELVGLEEIFSESKVPVVTWNSIEKLKADWFENGDIIEINKKDWEENENPLDVIATKRSVGHTYKEVFQGLEDMKYIRIFEEFFFNPEKCKLENKLLHGRFVIFENPPSKKYLAHF